MSKELSADFEDADVVITQSAEDISLAQNDIDDQINSIFSEVGSDKNEITFHFQVWRILKDQADMAFLFKGFVSDLPIMERLRDEYDGGKFFIQIYKNKKRYKRMRVTVEAPKKNAPTVIKNEMAEMIKAINEQQQQQFAMLKDTILQISGKQTLPAVDPMTMMTSMLNAMLQMKNFVTPPQQNNSVSPDKMIEVLIKGMELGRESGGGGDTNMLDIAKEAIKAIPHLSAMSTNNIVPEKPLKHNPSGQLEQKPKQILNSPKPEVNKMQKIIAHNLNMLVEKAEKDSDPILYAEFILDNVPEEMIKQYILRDDLIEEMSKINPKVLDHRKWFTELRDHIHGVLTGEGEEDETVTHDETISVNAPIDPSGDGGDAPNT